MDNNGFVKSIGYQECVGCGSDALIHPLCGWCQLGAQEHNSDPDLVLNPDFDDSLLSAWADAGKRRRREGMNRRPSQEQIIEKIQRMAVDVPVWMFEGYDSEITAKPRITCFICKFETTELALMKMKSAGCDDGVCKDEPSCTARRKRHDTEAIRGLGHTLRLMTFTQEHGEQLIEIIRNRMPSATYDEK